MYCRIKWAICKDKKEQFVFHLLMDIEQRWKPFFTAAFIFYHEFVFMAVVVGKIGRHSTLRTTKEMRIITVMDLAWKWNVTGDLRPKRDMKKLIRLTFFHSPSFLINLMDFSVSNEANCKDHFHISSRNANDSDNDISEIQITSF